jgi:hypothetical protein
MSLDGVGMNIQGSGTHAIFAQNDNNDVAAY